jgi:hypothetical protein
LLRSIGSHEPCLHRQFQGVKAISASTSRCAQGVIEHDGAAESCYSGLAHQRAYVLDVYYQGLTFKYQSDPSQMKL